MTDDDREDQNPASDDAKTRLAQAYMDHADKSPQEFYDDWADKYDEDVEQSLGYVAPKVTVQAFSEYVPEKNAAILDIACGTGLAGQLLHDSGYRCIDGVDISPGMLHKARQRGVYRQLGEQDLLQPIEAAEPYHAAIGVGFLGFGPVFARHLGNLLNALKSQALLVTTVNGKAWRELPWQQEIDEARQNLGFTLVETRTIAYLEKENIDGRLLIIRKK